MANLRVADLRSPDLCGCCVLEYQCVNPVSLLLIWTSDSVPLVPTAVFLEPRGASGGVSSSAWISDRGRGFLLFNAWVTLALPGFVIRV